MGVEDWSFATRLLAGRRSAGLSQAELAHRSGLSIRAISDLERGRTQWPYRNSVFRLADALELSGQARAEFVTAAGRRLGRAPSAEPPSRPGRPRHRDDRAVDGSPVPRQLPGPVPGFAGRTEQLAVLSRLLHTPGGTAVISTIGGMAGVGKTALAVQWGHRVAADFPDGQLFVNLRGFDPAETPVSSADAVRVLLDALGVTADRLPATEDGQFGLYRSLLAGKRLLVVLDNARDVAQVRPLLPGSLTCRVVVTSQNQLTGLTTREAARPLQLSVLNEAEASQLLRYRVGDDRVASEPDAVARIIESCAHLPLALCVVSARAAMRPDLSLGQIAAEVTRHRGLDAFSDDSDQAADVRAAFHWSYRQLDPVTARVFRLAGLHPGPGFSQGAIAALTGLSFDVAGRVLDILTRAGMIQRTGEASFGVHDLLRGYASELAGAHDSPQEQRAALTGLFDYYLHSCAAAMDVAFPAERHRRPEIGPPPVQVPAFAAQAQALAWLDAQRGELVAVAVYASEHGWPQHATKLAATLFRYFSNGAFFADAIAVDAAAYRAAHELGDLAGQAVALLGLGTVDLRQGRYQEAADHLSRALELCRQIDDGPCEARALANLGVADLLLGRPTAAVGHFEDSLVLHRKLADRTGEARALGNLGFAALRQGRYEQAIGHLRQSLEICQQIPDRGGEARALANLGEVELSQQRYQHAADYLMRALALWRELGDRSSMADTLASLGVTELRQNRHVQAAACLAEALRICRQTGDVPRQALALSGLGEVMLATGRPAVARQRYAAALTLAAEAADRYEQARAHDGLGCAYQAEGAMAQARRHWREALARYSDLGAPEADRVRARLSASESVPQASNT
ncbi:MAG TPA: tetratricopeptide repeat protein [Streptosporangiaceae bacterium]|nr:tetratricopeptide repeat protein [Streptosporangiaceae bacterium]